MNKIEMDIYYWCAVGASKVEKGRINRVTFMKLYDGKDFQGLNFREPGDLFSRADNILCKLPFLERNWDKDSWNEVIWRIKDASVLLVGADSEKVVS